jgi:hypothetical protein
MKNFKIIVSLFTTLLFLQCSSLKFVKKPPFKIEKASYNNWFGGQPGVSGTKIEIKLKENSSIAFDSIFFRNKSTKIEINTTSKKTLLIGHFSTSKRKNRDLILDVNVSKEMKNALPDAKQIPFELNENEAILSYKIENKINYFKIKNVEKEKSVFFPRANNI